MRQPGIVAYQRSEKISWHTTVFLGMTGAHIATLSALRRPRYCSHAKREVSFLGGSFAAEFFPIGAISSQLFTAVPQH